MYYGLKKPTRSLKKPTRSLKKPTRSLKKPTRSEKTNSRSEKTNRNVCLKKHNSGKLLANHLDVSILLRTFANATNTLFNLSRQQGLTDSNDIFRT